MILYIDNETAVLFSQGEMDNLRKLADGHEDDDEKVDLMISIMEDANERFQKVLQQIKE